MIAVPVFGYKSHISIDRHPRERRDGCFGSRRADAEAARHDRERVGRMSGAQRRHDSVQFAETAEKTRPAIGCSIRR
jgi:hypothetical protein